MKTFAIIEIGSNNTKTHVYDHSNKHKEIFNSNTTIEFKANYKKYGKITENNIDELIRVIKVATKHADDIHIFGCSIFRNIDSQELGEINSKITKLFNNKINVVSQKDEALLTAYGCYSNIDYPGNICVFIGGGGSTEIIIVNNKQIIEKKFLDFGVVDITDKFPSLKNDIPEVNFDEVQSYCRKRIGKINHKCDVLILGGGDHLYWYNNAQFKLDKNTLYENDNQPFMITVKASDEYDNRAYRTSLNAIRKRSDNPKWFDGSRAMKATTNALSHIIDAKYIVPTKINMEDGLKEKLVQ